MTLRPGQSGNPAGREPGSRNSKTLAAEERLFARADRLVDDLVRRALAGEPAAMRLCAERVLPVRGRPLPIDLPPIRHLDDAQKAAQTIMTALKEGALAAREAVDLLRVVEGLTRLTGTVAICKKIARREVARAAQTLGFEHFFAGPPVSEVRRQRTEDGDAGWEAADAAAEADDAADAGAMPPEMAESGESGGADLSPEQRLGLQIVADSAVRSPGAAQHEQSEVVRRRPAPGKDPGTGVQGPQSPMWTPDRRRTVPLRSTLRRIRGTVERDRRMPLATCRPNNGLACRSLLIPRKTEDGRVPPPPRVARGRVRGLRKSVVGNRQSKRGSTGEPQGRVTRQSSPPNEDRGREKTPRHCR